MPKPVSRRVLIRKLRKLGFAGPFSAGRHQYMVRRGEKIFIPNPHEGDIDVPIIIRILKQLDISEKEFRAL